MERCRYLGGGMGVFPGITDRKEETIICCSCCSVSQSCLPLCDPSTGSTARQASLSFTISQSLLKLLSIESVMSSKPAHPLSPPSSPALNLSSIRVFSSGLALRIRWPKYWSFSFSIRPSNDYSGLISCRTDWFDLLAVQGTLKSLL